MYEPSVEVTIEDQFIPLHMSAKTYAPDIATVHTYSLVFYTIITHDYIRYFGKRDTQPSPNSVIIEAVRGITLS